MFLRAKCKENEETVDEEKARLIEEAAWKCSLNIQEIATLVSVDCSDLWFAQRFHSINGNFGDDLVLALFVSFESFGRAGQADDATTGA